MLSILNAVVLAERSKLTEYILFLTWVLEILYWTVLSRAFFICLGNLLYIDIMIQF